MLLLYIYWSGKGSWLSHIQNTGRWNYSALASRRDSIYLLGFYVLIIFPFLILILFLCSMAHFSYFFQSLVIANLFSIKHRPTVRLIWITLPSLYIFSSIIVIQNLNNVIPFTENRDDKLGDIHLYLQGNHGCTDVLKMVRVQILLNFGNYFCTLQLGFWKILSGIVFFHYMYYIQGFFLQAHSIGPSQEPLIPLKIDRNP